MLFNYIVYFSYNVNLNDLTDKIVYPFATTLSQTDNIFKLNLVKFKSLECSKMCHYQFLIAIN